MAYYDQNRGRGNFQQYRPEQDRPVPAFPADYVDYAEKLMREEVRNITTSKLRNILSMLMDVYNEEVLRTEQTLSPESMTALQLARIRIAYECGRDGKTKQFVLKANLLPWLKAVGDSRQKAIDYIHYLEAIVAYHGFFGGREN